MKGIAIGLSDTSKEILRRLKKTEFINEIYIASSYKRTKGDAEIPLKKPKVLLQDKWGKLDLIIFIGSIGAVVRLISPFVRSKENDPAILVMDAKARNVLTLLGGHNQGGDRFADELASALAAEAIFTSDSFVERWFYNIYPAQGNQITENYFNAESHFSSS